MDCALTALLALAVIALLALNGIAIAFVYNLVNLDVEL